MQLRELAQLNGTLRENDGMRCNNCGATDHKSWLVSLELFQSVLRLPGEKRGLLIQISTTTFKYKIIYTY